MARSWEMASSPQYWAPWDTPTSHLVSQVGRPIILTFIPATRLLFFFFFCYTLEKFIWRTQGPGQTWRWCLSGQRRHWAIGSWSRTQRQRYVDRSHFRALQSQQQPEHVWTVQTPRQPRYQMTENYYASLIRGPPEIIGILSIPSMSPIQPQVAESFKTVFPFGFSKVGKRETAPAIGHGGPTVQPFLAPKFTWLCFWAKQPTSSDFINRHFLPIWRAEIHDLISIKQCKNPNKNTSGQTNRMPGFCLMRREMAQAWPLEMKALSQKMLMEP